MADPNDQYYDNGGQHPPHYNDHDGMGAEVHYDPQQYSVDPSQLHYGQEEGYEQGFEQGFEQGYDQQQGYDGQAYDGQADHQAETEYATIPDIMFLNHYCASAHPPRDSSPEAKEAADLSWEPVREWLRTHSADEVRAAAQQRGDSAMTALHVACRNVPPSDIIDVLLSIALDTAQWQDSFGWLPIHYACACGADPSVIKSLAEAFPESKTTVDRRGRTPLHFALGNSNPEHPVSPAVVVLLSSTGAASYADDNGMLPLHYACAYGASEEALYVLTDAYDEAITTVDRLGRTPLHFALSNAGRKAAPAAVRLLLSLHKEIVNATGTGPLPLRVLAEYGATVRKGDPTQRESVMRCLEHLLSFNPDPTADFFTALQSLPDWLQDRAVVMPSVQVLLNVKIAQRFPTGVLLSDFFVQVLVIVFYAIVVINTIDYRFETSNGEQGLVPPDDKMLIPLYLGASYFFVRTLIQILSLLALGAFRVWVQNPSNWLDTAYIVCVFYWAARMGQPEDKWESNDRFRTGAAISVVLLWMKLLAYLRNTYIDFAVFLGGLFYVVRRLVAFLLCLCITLVAFSQMFFTLYRRDPTRCPLPVTDEKVQEEKIEDLQCGTNDDIEVYCTRWDAFLNTFTMLIGEVNDEQFKDSAFAIALFVLFMFLVVILLANVLIAIVTDSYKVIQDQRAAIVFWSNRLVFVAEMDAVANGPWKKAMKKLLGMRVEDNSLQTNVTFGKELWKRCMDLYEDDVDCGTFSLEFLCYTLLRIVTAIIIIPLWLFFGLCSFGSLWPPQVREAIFTSKVLKHSSEAEKDDELRKTQIRVLQQEVQTLKDDLLQELAIDRTQMFQMKSLVAERKQEIQSEMKHIKRIVAMLFEQQSGM